METRNHEEYIILFLNTTRLLCITWSFSFGVFKATYIASNCSMSVYYLARLNLN